MYPKLAMQGMKKDETDSQVRLAATVALYNALEFAQTNFDNDAERNYVMQMICEGTIAPDPKVREASFECLVKIAAHYYSKLPAYMQARPCFQPAADPEVDLSIQRLPHYLQMIKRGHEGIAGPSQDYVIFERLEDQLRLATDLSSDCLSTCRTSSI